MGTPNSKQLVSEEYTRSPQVRVENPLFLDESSSDVVFNVNSSFGTSRYPLHKDILRKEIPSLNCDNPDGIITRDHPEPQAVEQVLRYIYEKHVHFTDWKNASNVLEVAELYQITELRNQCENFLIESIRLRNAFALLDLALKHDLPNLKPKCLEFCRMAAFIVMKTRAFKEGSKSAVSVLAGTPDINIESELCVFHALWDWCIMNCIGRNQDLNENTITDLFSKEMASYVGFRFMSDDEKKTLRSSICELVNKGVSCSLEIKAGRIITDFMLDDVCAPMQFRCIVPAAEQNLRGDNIPCYNFSLNIDSYLLEVNTISLFEDKQKGLVNRLKIVGPSKVDFVWDKDHDKVYFEKVGEQFHMVSELDAASTVLETQFRSFHLLLLRAGVVYSIEIEPADNRSKWPMCKAYVPKFNKSDVKITQTAETCAGLQSLKFLQAY